MFRCQQKKFGNRSLNILFKKVLNTTQYSFWMFFKGIEGLVGFKKKKLNKKERFP